MAPRVGAAIWHIRICALNADQLVNERAKRAKYVDQLKNKAIRVKRALNEVGELIGSFRAEVETMIPEIAPPPWRA